MLRRHPHAALLSILTPSLLLGCNAVLGIDAPKTGVLSPINDQSTTADGGLIGDNVKAGSDDDESPAISEEEPSPYAWALWPMPNPSTVSGAANPQTFGVRSAGVIFDSLTKLEWQQGAESKARTRDDAEDYCASLKLGGAGFRLPSRIELISIVDFTQANPSVDPKAFPGAAPGKYWSASRYAASPERGWVVNFEFGTGVVFVEQADTPYLVRCVREGK